MNRRTGMFLIGLTAMVAATVSADTPGRHPRYLRARTDLRTAQVLMRVHDEPNVMRHVNAVHEEIRLAVEEIDRAAVLDRKDWQDNPPIDTRLDRPGRFQEAMKLLAAARRDIDQEEDNPRARQWRNAAFRHIDAAMDQLRKAARDLRMDRLEGY